MSGTSDKVQNMMIDAEFRGKVVAWQASTSYTLGQLIYGNTTSGAGKVMECITAGTSSGTEPTWSAVDSNTTDNTATWRVRPIGMPRMGATLYLALLKASKGDLARSTAYALNDFVFVSLTVNSVTKNYLYKCTTAGTSASSAPAYTGATAEAITDGTAVFTEQSVSLEANGSAVNEVTGNNYSRLAVLMNSTNWSATDSSSSTAAVSAGTSASTYNLTAQTFATSSGAWTSGTEKIGMFALFDAATGGNMVRFGGLTSSKQVVNNGDSLLFAAGSLQFQVDR